MREQLTRPGTRPRLLLAGVVGPTARGLDQVMSRLCLHLSGDWEVEALGVSPSDTRREYDAAIHGVRMRVRQGPFPKVRAEDAWLEQLMRERRPDVVVAIGPTWLTGLLIQQLQAWRPRTRIALYLPVEGAPAGPALPARLAQVDLCMTYTDNAAEGLRRLASAAGRPSAHIEAVGHGVDPGPFADTLRSAAGRRNARRALFPERPDLETAFLVLNPNRDYPRKRLDLTIRGFAAFARDKPDAYLVLHPGAQSGEDRERLQAVAEETGVSDRILLPFPDGATTEALNRLYLACDVGVSTAQGEGWGLTVFEHAATGAPMVLPAHTTFRELWDGAALFARCGDPEFVFFECADMFPADVQSLAGELDRLYADPDLRRRIGAACRRRAMDPGLAWASVAASITHTCRRTIENALPATG